MWYILTTPYKWLYLIEKKHTFQWTNKARKICFFHFLLLVWGEFLKIRNHVFLFNNNNFRIFISFLHCPFKNIYNKLCWISLEFSYKLDSNIHFTCFHIFYSHFFPRYIQILLYKTQRDSCLILRDCKVFVIITYYFSVPHYLLFELNLKLE